MDLELVSPLFPSDSKQLIMCRGLALKAPPPPPPPTPPNMDGEVPTSSPPLSAVYITVPALNDWKNALIDRRV